MSELRVALFTGNYHHVRDGVSQTLNRLVKFLEDNGVTVLVFGPTIDDPPMEHRGEMVAVPSMAMPGRPEYRITTGFPSEVRRRLQEFAPTLVHIATPDLLGFCALRWAQRRSIPVVSSYHTHFTSYLEYYNLNIIEKAGWKYLRWFYGCCRHVYVPSPSMAEELNRHGISEGIRIWARGVNTELFNPSKRDMAWRRSAGFDDGDRVVTFVSRLVWEKDLRVYVEAVRQARQADSRVKAMVVGDGPAREELEELLPEAYFTGFLTDDLPRAYASSDIFLFPSATETFGNVTLEAMSSGLPAVVADATGSKSLVESGVNGFLAPPRDTGAFAEAVGKIAGDDTLRKQMGESSRQKALTYAWENVNGRLLENYREVTGKSQPMEKETV